MYTSALLFFFSFFFFNKRELPAGVFPMLRIRLWRRHARAVTVLTTAMRGVGIQAATGGNIGINPGAENKKEEEEEKKTWCL